MHKMGSFNQNAIDITKLIKERNNLSPVPLRSEIKWHKSFDFVAVGNEDGSIDLFTSLQFVLVCKIQVHKKMINTLAWHHDFGEDSLSKLIERIFAKYSNERYHFHPYFYGTVVFIYNIRLFRYSFS